MRTITPAWDSPPVLTKTLTAFASEEDRWIALFSDPNPFSLSFNVHKYGPVSLDGLLLALQDKRLRHNDKWPCSPVEVANLFSAVGATPETAPAALRAYHQESSVKKWQPDNLFQAYYALLQQQGVEPGPDHALALLSDFNWEGVYGRVDSYSVTRTLPTLAMFCDAPGEDTYFLQRWLPTLQQFKTTVGTNSLGVALGVAFPCADSGVLASWCIEHADHQGLGYLVWQGRYPMHLWLKAVADSVGGNPRDAMDGERQTGTLDRRREQVQTLLALYRNDPVSPVSPTTLNQESRLFAQRYPEAIGNLVKAVGFEAKSQESFEWVATLCATGAVPVDHPAVTTWLTAAKESLQARADNLRSTGTDVKRNGLNLAWFAQWGSLVGSLSSHWADLAGRRFCLDMHAESTLESDIDACGDLSWLQQSDVLDALHSRSAARSGSLDLFVALLPRLNAQHTPFLGACIAQACEAGTLNANTVRSAWKKIDPQRFAATIPSTFNNGAAKVLYALTRSDPKSVLVTLRELGVRHRDGGYRETLQTWLTTQLGLSKSAPDLPEIDFNTTP